jgi:hypothetical protein
MHHNIFDIPQSSKWNFEFTGPNQITKFYWSWAGALVLIMKTVHRDDSSYFKMGPLHRIKICKFLNVNFSELEKHVLIFSKFGILNQALLFDFYKISRKPRL